MDEKIIWEWNDTHKFYKVHCPEGHYMTEWTDDRTDYENFSDAKTIYTGSDEKKGILHCITDGEHDRLSQLRSEKVREEEEKRRAKEI